MASSSPSTGNIVPLFVHAVSPPDCATNRALVVRAFAEATACLGRAAQLIDDGQLHAETKLALVRGVKELVIRTFGLNAAYMEAEVETFRLRAGPAAAVREGGETVP